MLGQSSSSQEQLMLSLEASCQPVNSHAPLIFCVLFATGAAADRIAQGLRSEGVDKDQFKAHSMTGLEALASV